MPIRNLTQADQETLSELRQQKGFLRGASIRANIDYIREKEGDTAIQELQEALSDSEFDIDLENIQSHKWYPDATGEALLFLATKLFSWDDEDLYDVGYNAPVFSLIVKTVMRFTSLESAFGKAPMIWQKNYKNSGYVEPVELNRDERYLTFRIFDFHTPHHTIPYLRGYLARFAHLLLSNKEVQVEATPCHDQASKDECTEFTVTWK